MLFVDDVEGCVEIFVLHYFVTHHDKRERIMSVAAHELPNFWCICKDSRKNRKTNDDKGGQEAEKERLFDNEEQAHSSL